MTHVSTKVSPIRLNIFKIFFMLFLRENVSVDARVFKIFKKVPGSILKKLSNLVIFKTHKIEFSRVVGYIEFQNYPK